jgi:N6-adenosine-specific RNA methylase IME4
MFANLPRQHFGAILADPPWRFQTWDQRVAIPRVRSDGTKSADVHYVTMAITDIAALPVSELATEDCCLFLWATWPNLLDAMQVITAWGFTYKTCGFFWAKAHANQLEMFQDHIDPYMGLGYWTRANSEPCLLATRGNPKRLNADVRQAIIEPRREHSRKPDCVYERIERLVAGPYLEIFARMRRRGWHAWGNELDKFTQYDGADDFERSIDECYAAVRERKAAGGKGWPE